MKLKGNSTNILQMDLETKSGEREEEKSKQRKKWQPTCKMCLATQWKWEQFKQKLLVLFPEGDRQRRRSWYEIVDISVNKRKLCMWGNLKRELSHATKMIEV